MSNTKLLDELTNTFNIGELVWVNYKELVLHTQVVGIGFDAETLDCKYEVSVAGVQNSNGQITAHYPEDLVFGTQQGVINNLCKEVKFAESFCYVEDFEEEYDLSRVDEVIEGFKKRIENLPSFLDAAFNPNQKKFEETVKAAEEAEKQQEVKAPAMDDYMAVNYAYSPNQYQFWCNVIDSINSPHGMNEQIATLRQKWFIIPRKHDN